jgi:hypothetical protein
MLHVHFVPLFEHFNGFLAPRDVVIGGQALYLGDFELELPDGLKVLLAVEVVDVGRVTDGVVFPVNFDDLGALEEHGSEDGLFVC